MVQFLSRSPAGVVEFLPISAGSILDISKYRDTCVRSISILGGIAILRYIEYRMNQ